MSAQMLDHNAAPGVWAWHHFQDARLRHSSRDKRVVTIAQAMAEQPGRTIAELFTRKYDIDATYPFFDRPKQLPMRSNPAIAPW